MVQASKINETQRELAAVLLPLPFSSIAYNKKTLAEFRALAISLGLEVDTNCIKCIPDLKAQIKLKMAKKEKATTSKEMSKRFVMRKGVDITTLGKRTNSENITDSEALQILQRNPLNIKLFVKYPKNWEELV